MSTASVNYAHLEPNSRSAYKQLFVKGTRIPARALYGWYACEEPMTPEQIATDYDIPLEAVREAIAYCESDPSELLEDYSRQEALMEAMGLNESDYAGKPKRLSPQDRARIRCS